MKRLTGMLKGVEMANCRREPRALFLFLNEEPKTDTEICSGHFPSHLKGKPCPFSDRGRLPPYIESRDEPIVESNSTDYLAPDAQPCKLQKLGRVDQWQKEVPLIYPEEYGHKMLYKCRQMFMLVLLS
jgi:hypothetical protein